MQSKVILLTFVTLSSTLAFADIDLSDFDTDVMRGMDDTIKILEPDIAAKNAQAASDEAKSLLEGFKWTEGYFAQKNTEDAVQYARDAQALTKEILEHLAKQDFDNASASARRLSKSCKTCHDVYKTS
jgi:cytochrome c556